jgi:energy-converting hydrogenase B subunit D
VIALAAEDAGLTVLQAVLLIAVAIGGLAVAATREPVRQAIVAGIFGLLLAALFFAFQAPDVALSQITVGSVALPAMILLAVARTRARAARAGGGDGEGRAASGEREGPDPK